MNFASILGFIKQLWPILSMLVGAYLSAHANAAHTAAVAHVAGADSSETQLVHVVGSGITGMGLLAVGAGGGLVNHYRGKATAVEQVKAAEKQPSVPPLGLNEVLHREDELHSAMLSDPATTPAELDALNGLIKIRKPGVKPVTTPDVRTTP